MQDKDPHDLAPTPSMSHHSSLLLLLCSSLEEHLWSFPHPARPRCRVQAPGPRLQAQAPDPRYSPQADAGPRLDTGPRLQVQAPDPRCSPQATSPRPQATGPRPVSPAGQCTQAPFAWNARHPPLDLPSPLALVRKLPPLGVTRKVLGQPLDLSTLCSPTLGRIPAQLTQHSHHCLIPAASLTKL